MDRTQEVGESARVWERVDVPTGQLTLEPATWDDLMVEVERREAVILVSEGGPARSLEEVRRRIVVLREDGSVWEAHYSRDAVKRRAHRWPDGEAAALLSVTRDEYRRGQALVAERAS